MTLCDCSLNYVLSDHTLQRGTPNIGTCVAHLVLEESSQCSVLALSSSIVPNPVAGLPLPHAAFLEVSASCTQELQSCFALRLDPGVPMCTDTALAICELLSQQHAELPHLCDEVGSAPTLQTQSPPTQMSKLLDGEAISLQGLLLATCTECHISQNMAVRMQYGRISSQQWHVSLSGQPSVTIKRLPFAKLACLLGVLGLLRQQLVFNRLFLSCFEESATLGGSSGANEAIIACELIVEPSEHQLQVCTLHPNSGNMLAIMISVSKTGAISSKTTVMNGDPLLDYDVLMTKVLQVSMDIPLALDEVFLSTNSANSAH